jgi:hypothetical protein
VDAEGGLLTVTDSTVAANSISPNTAPQLGAGVHLTKTATGVLADDTLAGNTVAHSAIAGGPQLAIDGSSAVSLSDSLLSGPAACSTTSLNAFSETHGTIESEGGNTGTDQACALSKSTDTISSGLKLGTLGSHGGSLQTIPLLAGSAAIGAGSNCALTSTDERGEPRPASGCDSGAYEFAPAAVHHLSASHAKPDSRLTISGSGLLFTTKVSIGGKSARFTVVSDTKLKIVVPSLSKSVRRHAVAVVVASRDGAGRHGTLHVV